MTVPARRRSRSLLPDVADMFESFPMWPSMWGTGEPGTHGIRIEDFVENDRYVVRAEIAGIDPAKDVDITVEDHVLTVRAERSEEKKDKQHSEFRYGSFSRSVALPEGAQEDKITASYENGILAVTVPIAKTAAESRHIPVQRG